MHRFQCPNMTYGIDLRKNPYSFATISKAVEYSFPLIFQVLKSDYVKNSCHAFCSLKTFYILKGTRKQDFKNNRSRYTQHVVFNRNPGLLQKLQSKQQQICGMLNSRSEYKSSGLSFIIQMIKQIQIKLLRNIKASFFL